MACPRMVGPSLTPDEQKRQHGDGLPAPYLQVKPVAVDVAVAVQRTPETFFLEFRRVEIQVLLGEPRRQLVGDHEPVAQHPAPANGPDRAAVGRPDGKSPEAPM